MSWERVKEYAPSPPIEVRQHQEVSYEFMDVHRRIPLNRLPGGKIMEWNCKPEEATYEKFIPQKK